MGGCPLLCSEGFTGEESEGKYVDMHALHDAYLNLKGAERIDYCLYLAQCANLSKLPKETALTSGYAKYAKSLLDYFVSFLGRTQPLMPLGALLKAAEEDFDARWLRGEVRRWQQAAHADADNSVEQIDMAAYNSAKELGKCIAVPNDTRTAASRRGRLLNLLIHDLRTVTLCRGRGTGSAEGASCKARAQVRREFDAAG